MKKLLLSLTIAAVAFSLPVVLAQGKGKGQGQGKDRSAAKPAANAEQAEDRGKPQKGGADARITFGSYSNVIQDYYRPRQGSLPPGLEKQLQRNGTLPPGLQKKLKPFPVELERRLPPIPAGYSRHIVGAQAVILEGKTNRVVDMMALVDR